MNGLLPYSLPIKGLRDGIHTFQFSIGREFFKLFEDSPVEEGTIELSLVFDKRPNLFVLEFDFSGKIRSECDRCLAEINLPIGSTEQLLIKFSEEPKDDDPEVIYIHPEASDLNVAPFIYEFIVLSVPMIKVYDCEDDQPRPCNLDMLQFLADREVQQVPDPEDVTEDAPEDGNPIWEDLKKKFGDS